MPGIFDNIDQELLPALRQTLEVADRPDFCVGYFNLRSWKQLDGQGVVLDDRSEAVRPWVGRHFSELPRAVKVKAATDNETFESWREREHDDLALACWYGQHKMNRWWIAFGADIL